MPIIFYFDDVKKPKGFVVKTFKSWINELEKHYNIKIKNLTYIFVDDEKLLSINQQYLNHDTFTDIITFDMSDNDNYIDGEIYISLERIVDNANTFNVLILEELIRVVAHGLLHLIGFGDKNKKAKKLMTEQENLCIDIYNKLQKNEA